MKTKLYVAGIGGCLLIAAYFTPSDLFSFDPQTPAIQDSVYSSALLDYKTSELPGLEIKTPAKIAIVNKMAVAANLKADKKEKKSVEILASKQEKTPVLEKVEKTPEPEETQIAEQYLTEADAVPASSEEISSDIPPYIKPTRTLKVPGANMATTQKAAKIRVKEPQIKITTPVVREAGAVAAATRPKRIVEDFATTEFAVNTSNTNTGKKFPHDNEEEDVAAREELEKAEATESVKAETVVKVEEKFYAFRGKAAVKASLFKYVPPFWDGFSQELGEESADRTELIRKAKQLAAMAKKNGYNTDIAFLADMSVKSNKNRFFIVNLKTMRIEKTSLLAQGRGREKLNLDKDYSNTPGSNLSSLGIYKVGKSYNGAFGHSYRLFGLEESNSKAFQRAIVLHAMGTIPDMETNFPIWQSEGCPSVSPGMLKQVGNMIDRSPKPILFWMYDDNYLPMS